METIGNGEIRVGLLFGALLRELMDAGLRPGETRKSGADGSPVVGRPWGNKELADALPISVRQLLNWLEDESLPENGGSSIRNLERVLLGSNQKHMREIRLELRRALVRSHESKRIPKAHRPPQSTLGKDWARNHNRLSTLVDTPVPGDLVPASRLYVSIRARYEETWDRLQAQYRNDEADDADRYRPALKSIAVDLEASLLEWLYGEIDSFDAIRLVRSGPGGGKSTAARHLARTVIKRIGETKEGYPGVGYVLFIPLQYLDADQKDVRASLSAYLTEAAGFTTSPLDEPSAFSRTSRLLMILDGLDEVGSTSETNREALLLVTTLQKWLGVMNANETRVVIAIFGRDASMQQVGKQLPLAPHQTLHILPYRVWDPAIRGQEELLADDQRYKWWGLWADAKSLSTDPPQVLRTAELSELTDDPLQLFLLASTGAYADPRVLEGRRTDFYHLVRDRVISNWHNRAGRGVADFGRDDTVVRLLEAIAVAAWSDGGRVTTIGKVLAYCGEDATLTAALGRLAASQDIGRAMLMFYTRAKAPSEGSDGIEFTHKSLSDFMVASALARRTWGAIIEAGRRSPLTYDSWADLFADGPMSGEIAWMTMSEIAGAAGSTLAVPHFAALWSGIMNTLPARWSNAREHIWGRDETAFAILAFVHSMLIGNERLLPAWDHSESAGEAIRRVSGLASTPEWHWRFPYRSFVPKISNAQARRLRYIDFSAQRLCSLSITQLDLFGCSFQHANLSASSLVDCTLCAAQFDGANLQGTTWHGCNISGATFVGADIRGADFRLANGLTTRQFVAATFDGTTLFPETGLTQRAS